MAGLEALWGDVENLAEPPCSEDVEPYGAWRGIMCLSLPAGMFTVTMPSPGFTVKRAPFVGYYYRVDSPHVAWWEEAYGLGTRCLMENNLALEAAVAGDTALAFL